MPWRGWVWDFSHARAFNAVLPATYGGFGVALFFVVSGFCIHLSFARGAPGDWRGFYGRRFFRIYPPYLLVVLLFALVLPTTRLNFHHRTDWLQLASHLALVHNFIPKFYHGLSPAFWSIAVEVQLYLLYPLLLALVNLVRWQRTLGLLLGLELLLRAVGYAVATTTGHKAYLIDGLPFTYWYSWAIGAALADAFVCGRPLPFTKISAWMWLFLALITYGIKPLSTFSFLLFALATVTVLARLLEGEAIPARIEGRDDMGLGALWRGLSVMGLWSYSLYLLHQPLLQLVPRVINKLSTVPPHPLVTFVGCLASLVFIVPLAGLCYRFCELPSIALGKRLRPRSSPHQTPTRMADAAPE